VAHAALDLAVTHPDLTRRWHASSNTLVVLCAPDEPSLRRLCDEVTAAGLTCVPFHEPDLGGALTAAALEPAAHHLVSHLPLALPRVRGGEVNK
jgi:hypothetical protein